MIALDSANTDAGNKTAHFNNKCPQRPVLYGFNNHWIRINQSVDHFLCQFGYLLIAG
jgi:hypothetical protein